VLGILLWTLIGWQAVTGLAFAIILIPYEAEMTGWVAKLRMEAARVTDRRLEVMNEIISGIRAVKMYAWEWPYRDAVKNIRRSVNLNENHHDTTHNSCSLTLGLYYPHKHKHKRKQYMRKHSSVMFIRVACHKRFKK
jgi:hypothetical protein